MRVDGRNAYKGRYKRFSAASNGDTEHGEGRGAARPSPPEQGDHQTKRRPSKVTFGPAEDMECACSPSLERIYI
jgi:hypothetical protein